MQRSQAQAPETSQASAADLLEVEKIYQQIIARAPEHRPNPSLDKVHRVLSLMGNPQDSFAVIHVAGTNGKTSTARMIDSLLTAAGLRVGRFTSPHLVDVRERISVCGAPISAPDFITAYRDIEIFLELAESEFEAAGTGRLSFFEVFTVMAFAAFAAAPVDVAVIEVGMGGTWDATNVVQPAVAAITPISLDHQQWLGESLLEIAAQKAGIIKPGTVALSGPQKSEVSDLLARAAQQADVPFRRDGIDFAVRSRTEAVGGQLLSIATSAAIYEDIHLPLFGAHQAGNAALALAATETFLGGAALDPKLVEAGFAAVTSPGRLEVIKSSPTIIADAAHNPDGIEHLVRTLEQSFDFNRIFGVFSAMGDKNVEAMLGILEPALEAIVVTQMPGPRAMPLAELTELAQSVFGEDRVYRQESLSDALDYAVALSQAGSDPLTATATVVCGSVSLVGAARELVGIN